MNPPTDTSPTVSIQINGQPIEVAEGTTVLDAARGAGCKIPTLCHLEGQPGFSSCMLCTVEDKATGKTFPSCAIAAAPGMDIETENPMLTEKRRTLLELMMSDHSGDCEAPCTLACPASVPIPEIIRLLRSGQPEEAAVLLRQRTPLAGVLERICGAHCEGGCRRGKVDESVSIMNVCRYAADLPVPEDARLLAPGKPVDPAYEGKRVAVLGAGPAGLSVACHLARAGVDVTVFDDHEEAGGMLRYAVEEDQLPRNVLDAEIDLIRRAGVKFELNHRVGEKESFDEWKNGFDVVSLCIGEISDPAKESKSKKKKPHPSPTLPDEVDQYGVKKSTSGIKVDKASLQTSGEGVFCGGDAIRFFRKAVKAVGDGHRLSVSIQQFLRGDSVAGEHDPFKCTMSKFSPEELAKYATRATPDPRQPFTEDPAAPLPMDDIVKEANRCLACDCEAKHDCDLREHCDTYGAKPNRLKPLEPIPYFVDQTHPEIDHDPGKCIRCAICIRLSELKQEAVGLAPMGRGIEKRPGPPTGKTWAEALQKDPGDYCAQCPTAAISPKRH